MTGTDHSRIARESLGFSDTGESVQNDALLSKLLSAAEIRFRWRRMDHLARMPP